MEPNAAQEKFPPPPPGGRLTDNLLAFARTLRAAGLPVGPGSVLTALRAVRATGLARRDDFYWSLHAVFVRRRDQQDLFDQAFTLFWRNPKLLEQIMTLLLPDLRPVDVEPPADATQLGRRLLDALAGHLLDPETSGEDEAEREIDAAFSWSDKEVLHRLDFETMTAEEMALAKQAMARLRLPIVQVATRRFRPTSARGLVDLRASLRASLRAGSGGIALRRKTRQRRPPPLVILCDISGSMSRYSRMLLHFMHAVTNDRDRVHSFLFGTRLTNITRTLRHKDVDLALDRIADGVRDWSGGTRIGSCLRDFNRYWSRRVLTQGALVLFISDGLDRETSGTLGREMERLHKSCRRLIWLNPLLRYDMYEPKAQGARAILPHVDDFHPVHNLESLEHLAGVLSQPAGHSPRLAPNWMNSR